MSRVRHVLIIVLPSMLVGGLLFGFWPARADNGDPWNRGAPVPPAPPAPPAMPAPPAPPATPPPGATVVIHGPGGKISVENVSEMVRKQLDQARDMVRDSPHIPPQVRATVLARLERVRAAVERRLARMKPSDLKDLGDEVERVSDDIEQAMDGLDEDLTKLGKELSKQFGKQWAKEWKKQWKKQAQEEAEAGEDQSGDGEDGEDGEAAGPPPVDPEDARNAIADVRGIALQPQQRVQIQRLREQTEKQVAEAQTQLAMLSSKLEEALKNPRVSDDEVKMYVDHISATEATIRKAKLLAWVGARRLLDEQQRAKIEAAARQRSRQR
jgi:hypothetical protein